MNSHIENNLLMVGNFSVSTGYAWNTINTYFLAVGQMFREFGSRAIICYPKVDEIPARFTSAGIEVIKFDFFKANFVALYLFIKQYRIQTLYVTDKPVFSFKYLVCRLAAVKNIIVHDHTSGDRKNPGFFKTSVKTVINHYPLISADIALAVSGFVKKRLIRVSCFPENRTVRIWNGVDIEKFKPGSDNFVFTQYGIPRGKKIIFAYSRANKYKGIQTLIEAANILIHEKKRDDLFFLFCGDGPDLEYFRSLVIEKNLNGSFLCTGVTNAIDKILKGVAIVVVPSIWQEAFGLSVTEGMAAGKVVIASRIGGIEEIITDSKDGFLVPPSNSQALSAKILYVLDNKKLQQNIGAAARRTIIENFNIEDVKKKLLNLFKIICFGDKNHQ